MRLDEAKQWIAERARGLLRAQGAADEALREKLKAFAADVESVLESVEPDSWTGAVEKSLLESESKYRAVIEESADCIFLVDGATRRLLDANRSFRRLLGYPGDEILTRTLDDLEAAGAAGTEALVRQLLGERRHYTGERSYRTRSGGTKDLEVGANALPIGEGTVLCFVGRDLSARRAAEEEKRRMEAQLLHAQKMEAVGTLAAGLAHDFNNLLTAIQGFCDLASLRTGGSHAVQEDLDYISEATRRAAEMTRQLLLFSRKQPMKLQYLDLNETVSDLMRMLGRLVGENVFCRLELAQELPPIEADRGGVEQVVLNLVLNARDAMPGGGTVTVSTGAVALDEEACNAMRDAVPGSYVAVRVADRGTGIPAEALSHIFDPFFTTKEAGKGTGLGLSVVYGIVRQHGGWMHVESEPGEGSVFHVYLPVPASSAVDAAPEAKAAAPAPGGGRRILVVEDEHSVRVFTVLALREQGYDAVEAPDAREALEAALEDGPPLDLLFTDAVLPDRRGLDLIERVRKIHPGLPVLFTSGYADVQARAQEFRDRGFVFLPKPYSLSELLSAVEAALARGPGPA